MSDIAEHMGTRGPMVVRSSMYIGDGRDGDTWISRGEHVLLVSVAQSTAFHGRKIIMINERGIACWTIVYGPLSSWLVRP